jgi:hypothetical protein
MGVLNPLFVGLLKRYKAITAGQVAQAMVILAGQDGNGVKVVENEGLLALAG